MPISNAFLLLDMTFLKKYVNGETVWGATIAF